MLYMNLQYQFVTKSVKYAENTKEKYCLFGKNWEKIKQKINLEIFDKKRQKTTSYREKYSFFVIGYSKIKIV